MPITFTKVKLPFGWLGNMAAFPIVHLGVKWRTAEALFQALRFEDQAIKEEIRLCSNPLKAKRIATDLIDFLGKRGYLRFGELLAGRRG